MKKLTLLLVFLFLATPTVFAQRTDISRLKPVSTAFYQTVKNIGAVEVSWTVGCNSNYRADWQPGTWVILTGAFFWTDSWGRPHLRFTTQPIPPPSLDGYRPRIVDIANVDGTLAEWDREYGIRYSRLLQGNRTCVDLEALLENVHLEKIWLYFIKRAGGATKFERELSAMGFNSNGTIFKDLPEDLATLVSQIPTLEVEYPANIPSHLIGEVIIPTDVEWLESSPAPKVENLLVPGVIGALFFVFLIGMLLKLKKSAKVENSTKVR